MACIISHLNSHITLILPKSNLDFSYLIKHKSLNTQYSNFNNADDIPFTHTQNAIKLKAIRDKNKQKSANERKREKLNNSRNSYPETTPPVPKRKIKAREVGWGGLKFGGAEKFEVETSHCGCSSLEVTGVSADDLI